MQVATGQAYGVAGAQRGAQAAVPVGTPGLPNPPQAGGPTAAPAPMTGLPPGMPAPGSLGDLLGPSADPSEHVMNGSASGPGLGLSALGLGPQSAPDMSTLVRWLPALEQMANRPTASSATRDLVRAIKSNVSLIPGSQ